MMKAEKTDINIYEKRRKQAKQGKARIATNTPDLLTTDKHTHNKNR